MPNREARIDDVDLRLLARYLSGECSAEERDKVDAILRERPWMRRQLDDVAALWRRASQLEDALDTKALRERILSEVRPTPQVPEKQPRRIGRIHRAHTPDRSRIWRYGAMAASVAAVAVIGALAIRGGYTPRLLSHETAVTREITTKRGERAKFTLPDGSKIVLAPASRLRVYSVGSDSTQLIELEGAARFDVMHRNERQFLVRTSRATIRDIGTVFAVDAYETSSTHRVGVAEGIVEIGRPEQSLPTNGHTRLEKGDLARISNDSIATEHGVDITAFLDDVTGQQLVFEGVPLRDALLRLEREFDVDIRITDSTLSARRIRATLTHASVWQALDELAAALNTAYVRRSSGVDFGAVNPK